MTEKDIINPLHDAKKLEVPHSLLSMEEHNRRWNKIRLSMKEQGLSCLIIDGIGFPGPSYARYVTNSGMWNSYVVFPYEGEVTEVVSLRSLHGLNRSLLGQKL